MAQNGIKMQQASNSYHTTFPYNFTGYIKTKPKLSTITFQTILTLLKRLIERSTSKETATKMVNTVATDQVGVKANDLVSFPFSAILKYPKPNSKP